jgi:hypothetical protein
MTTAVDHTKDLCDQCGAELAMPENPRQRPEHECGVLFAELLDYDWCEAFAYAKGEWISDGPARGERPNQPFDRKDVAEIYGSDEGENDGASWIMLGKLKNGLFFFLSAGCDYTGWDCQAGGNAFVSDNLNNLITFGTDLDDRDRLKIPLVALNYQPPEPTTVEIRTVPLPTGGRDG